MWLVPFFFRLCGQMLYLESEYLKSNNDLLNI